MSDDGSIALVVIALLGSPFSPNYARARSQGSVKDPLDFSAFNVSVSRPGTSHWALTERTAGAVARDRTSLAIGRSSMRWTTDGLAIDVDERTAPWGRPLRGRILFRPEARTQHVVPIDARGDHLWWPVAPLGRVEVALDDPGLRFQGSGYLDANAGSGPLEDAFARWSWSRLSTRDRVAITYDVSTRNAGDHTHGMTIDRDGLHPLEAREQVGLGMTRFGLPRTIRSPSRSSRLVRTVEDGPFYARSLVEAHDERDRLQRGVHEVVSLDRFASSWVRFLIPFRMRREAA